MHAVIREVLFPQPVWTRPELYYTDDAVGPFPAITDGLLNIVVGTDTVGNPIPGPVIIFGLAATRNGWSSTSQSTGVGVRSQPGDSVSTGYDFKMFNGGLKAGPAGNLYGVTLIGQTSLVALAESNDSAYGFTDEGETPHTAGLKKMADLALANKGVALADNKWVTSANGKSGTSLGLRIQGTLNYFFIEGAVQAQNSLVGSGYALWIVTELGQENDAVGQIPRDVFYGWLADGLFTPQYTLARAISNQKQPVRLLTWQNSRGLLISAGAALGAYDFAVNHPCGAGFGPNWIFERYTGDDVHFVHDGTDAYAQYLGRAMYQMVFEGRKPDMIKLVSTRYEGGVIKVVFDVPTAPLVIDAVTYGAAFQHGFRAFDGVGDFALSNITASGSEVWMTPVRAPSGSFTVNVGLDYAVSGGTFPRPVADGSMCTVCDSTPGLPHWVPHFYVSGT